MTKTQLKAMRNQAMARKLAKRECLDISRCERTAGGDYLLEVFRDEVDYCDAAQEAWVWSIGKLLEPADTVMANGDMRTLPAGTFLASLSSRHYSAGESQVIECVWLR